MPFIHLLLLLSGFASAPEARVAIQTFKFRPDTIVVTVGASVVWVNGDEIEHTVTADSAGVRLDAALPGKGSTHRATFAAAGLYAYHCERHAFMRGVVRVTAPAKGVRP